MILKKNINLPKKYIQCGSDVKSLHRIHVGAQQKVKQDDDTLLYSGKFPRQSTQKIRHLTMRASQYLIHNWVGEGFPSVIYIALDGFNDGYIGSNGKPSNKIAALQLTSVNSNNNQGYVSFSLKYNMRQTITWKLPFDLEQINFRLITELCSQQNNVQMPLPNPLNINFQIRTQ